jgi:hypothetical protein
LWVSEWAYVSLPECPIKYLHTFILIFHPRIVHWIFFFILFIWNEDKNFLLLFFWVTNKPPKRILVIFQQSQSLITNSKHVFSLLFFLFSSLFCFYFYLCVSFYFCVANKRAHFSSFCWFCLESQLSIEKSVTMGNEYKKREKFSDERISSMKNDTSFPFFFV